MKMDQEVQTVLETTQEILKNPTEILNIEKSGIDAALESLIQATVDFGLKILVAVLILSGGIWLANKITRSFKRMMEIRNFDPSLQSFLGSFINILLKIFVFIIVLTTVGVQMTSIVAVLGAASLAVGMALQGTLQNFAGGIVILMFKPFRVGDTVETASGKVGVVKKIMIFTTELHTFDNQVVFLPNGALANGIITNLSHGKNRRTDLTVSISYGDSVDAARRAILEIVKKDKRILKTPEPVVFVSSLSDSSVDLVLRFWTSYTDMYPVMADINEQIYAVLPKKKVHFPFPQMDVHIVK
ncbi:MAG: mechanosensitive ion channel [Alphaproteobacteria bacterium]|nr:mechanosensitive ion channel [Alphaproteobacteria bacterium]